MTIYKGTSFHALNRYSARQVLEVLRHGPHSVAGIHATIKLGSRENISHALALLLKTGLVSRHRHGRQNFYQLQPEPFNELIDYLKGLHRDAKKRLL